MLFDLDWFGVLVADHKSQTQWTPSSKASLNGRLEVGVLSVMSWPSPKLGMLSPDHEHDAVC